jgi:dinuclear metal center YbgI/SA1388 family protein
MQYKELRQILENKIAPIIFKKQSEFYGIQYGTIDDDKLIKRIMITLDLDLKAIYHAIKNKVNLIISHHPLLIKPAFNFDKMLINQLNLLSKYPLSIYILNSPFIASENGISQTIADILYLKIIKIFELKNINGTNVPIGRICSPKYYLKEKKKFHLKDLLNRIIINFNLEIIEYVGNLEKEIKKICIIAGDSENIICLKKALNIKCDCYITSNLNHEKAIYANDLGMSIIKIPHYNAEFYSLKKLYNYLSLEFPFDEFLLYNSKNPFNYYQKESF